MCPSYRVTGSLLFARSESWIISLMLRGTEFRELVSGRRKGLAASCMRGFLRVVEAPYSLAVNVRNRRYDRSPALAQHVAPAVISVGNLTLGGTGKTPMVKWLAQRLQDDGARVALVSRGYGAANGQQNDEALELAESLPGVPHIQNRDRVAAANVAIHDFNPQLLILDDGFQHRRLARDLDIVLLDALEPFGFDHVFPRGTLREPITGLRRADVVCLSRADAVLAPHREAIRRRVAEVAPTAAWCELAHVPSNLMNSRGDTRPLDSLGGKRVAAFCGIGNPAGFRHTLAAIVSEPVAWREFPDHYAYSLTDQSELVKMAREAHADAIVCTQKDLVKLQQHELGGIPLWAVRIELQFLWGQDALEQLLERVRRHFEIKDER